MKRKIIRTSFFAILLLCGLLLTSCAESTQIGIYAYMSSPTKSSFHLDASYNMTIKCGHTNNAYGSGRTVALLCCGYNAQKKEPTETQVLYEFDSFFAEENLIDTRGISYKGLPIWSNWKYPIEVTVEIPKSQLEFENGFIMLFLGERPSESGNGLCYCQPVWYEYQKTDGEIHFEKVK